MIELKLKSFLNTFYSLKKGLIHHNFSHFIVIFQVIIIITVISLLILSISKYFDQQPKVEYDQKTSKVVKIMSLIFFTFWIILIICSLLFSKVEFKSISEIINLFNFDLFVNIFTKECNTVTFSIIFVILTLIIFYFSRILFFLIKIITLLFLIVVIFSIIFDIIEREADYVDFASILLLISISIILFLLIRYKLAILNKLYLSSKLILKNILCIIPVVVISSIIVGFILTISISLISRTEYNFIYVLFATSTFLWTFNFIVLFVKTFSVIIFYKINSSFFESFKEALKKTIRNSKKILCLSFIPAWFSSFLSIINQLIFNVELINHYKYKNPTLTYNTTRFIQKYVILRILRTLRYIFLPFMIVGKYNTELSVVSIGLNLPLKKENNNKIWKTIKTAVFSYLFHIIPSFICTYIFLIFTNNIILYNGFRYFINNMGYISFYSSLPINIANMCTLHGQSVVLFGVCFYMIYTLISIVYTGILFIKIVNNVNEKYISFIIHKGNNARVEYNIQQKTKNIKIN